LEKGHKLGICVRQGDNYVLVDCDPNLNDALIFNIVDSGESGRSLLQAYDQNGVKKAILDRLGASGLGVAGAVDFVVFTYSVGASQPSRLGPDSDADRIGTTIRNLGARIPDNSPFATRKKKFAATGIKALNCAYNILTIIKEPNQEVVKVGLGNGIKNTTDLATRLCEDKFIIHPLYDGLHKMSQEGNRVIVDLRFGTDYSENGFLLSLLRKIDEEYRSKSDGERLGMVIRSGVKNKAEYISTLIPNK